MNYLINAIFRNKQNIVFITFLFFTMSACTANKANKAENLPLQASPLPDDPSVFNYKPPQPSEGSLWTENSANLFTDKKARQVGDLLTIRISESPTGKLHAKTDTNRESTITGSAEFLGLLKALERKNNTDALTRLDRTNLIGTTFKPEFVGEGTIDRDGSMTAYITAVVTRVFPNGNLYVSGKRDIKIDNETQYIKITGIVRPEDIDLNNEVVSTYIGDAKIEYSGQGVIAEKQKPGWLMRILDYTWPF